jgi:hypothetical protein
VTATLAPPVKVISAEWSSPAPITIDLSIVADADMAWLLADAATACPPGYERTMTFVELGSGEHYLAIKRILNAVMSDRMTMPVAIFDRLTRWLDGYADAPEEPQLRTMLAELEARQLEPIALRTREAQCGHAAHTTAPACSVSVAR